MASLNIVIENDSSGPSDGVVVDVAVEADSAEEGAEEVVEVGASIAYHRLGGARNMSEKSLRPYR